MIVGQRNILGNSRPSISSTVHNRKVKRKYHNLFQIVLSGHALKESRGGNKTSNIIVITAIVSLLSIVTVVLFPFGQSQAAAALLDIIKTRRSLEEYNSYLFMVLCHEYLHSFGIVDELQVRKMTYDLCLSLLGENHPACLMARYEPWAVFPDLNLYQTNKFEEAFEIVKNFDRTTQSYVS